MSFRGHHGYDRVFFILVSILVIFGLLALFSAGAPVGYARFGDANFFIKGQILYGLLPGLFAIFVINKISTEKLRRLSWLVYVFSLVLLTLVFIPGVGLVLNNSRSWIHIGFFNFQPAEFSKLAVIFILAHLLSQKIDWEDWRSFTPAATVVAPTIILILMQPDIGTLSIIGVIIFAMLVVAKAPSKYLISLAALGVLALALLIIVAPYRASRITTFLHPELDPKGVGYQMNQAFLAVGSGGFWGLGFGQSRQKFQYLPEVSADTIFAVIAEENGFLISVALVLLIFLIVSRGLKIAKNCHDQFGALLTTGIMVWFGWQSFLNIGATIGVLPLTGVPLPFISHGGSALLMALTAVGLVLNISKQSNV